VNEKMATATQISPKAPSLLINQKFTLADRMRIQDDAIRDRNYQIIGRLTSVVWEGQRKLGDFSQSRARYHNSDQAKYVSDAMKPFSERQAVLWGSITLDWLTHKNAPLIAISRDQRDLLLPRGLTPLPPLPDPRWVPEHAQQACPNSKKGCKGCVAPRIPQRLTGCPIVGDRVQDQITDRSGKVYGVLHPITELCVMLFGGQGAFGRIRGAVDSSDGTHLSLLIDDSNPEEMKAYFVGGRFQLGG
jgi:hypothetical protein